MSSFKSWRRKIGIVTLVMACVFMAGWARSQTIAEFVSFRSSPSRVTVFSSWPSFLVWNCRGGASPATFYGRMRADYDFFETFEDLKNRHHWAMCGFQSVSGQNENGVPIAVWIIPYDSIVLPLTLLSAWLLLSNPGTRKPSPTAMSDFKPLRRKLGVVTLVIACVLAAGWVRSFEKRESLHLTLWQVQNIVISVDGKLVIARCPAIMQFGVIGWITLPTTSVFGPRNGSLRPVGASTLFNVHEGNFNKFEWRRQFFGFDCGTIVRASDSARRIRYIFAPYWSLVIPLTLLSAYLLLSKPRMRQQPITHRAHIPRTSTGPDKDPAIASAPEVAADY